MANIDLQHLNPVFAQKLSAMLAAAKASGIDPGTLNSAYRSAPHQADIYADSWKGVAPGGKQRYMAAPPGGSMHGSGLATDISSSQLTQLRKFATDHPEMGIYPLPGDAPHFQLAGNQYALRAHPPTLPEGSTFDPVAAMTPYAAKGTMLTDDNSYIAGSRVGESGRWTVPPVAMGGVPGTSLNSMMALANTGPPIQPNSVPMPPAPSAYGGSSSVPTPPGMTVNTMPGVGSPGPSAPVQLAGGAPNTATAPPAPPVAAAPDAAAAAAPSPASLFGSGDIKGGLASIAGNPDLMKSMGDLGNKASGKDQQAAPQPMQAPHLQTNQAQIAQMAPQMMGQLAAKGTGITPPVGAGGPGGMTPQQIQDLLRQQQMAQANIPGMSLGGVY